MKSFSAYLFSIVFIILILVFGYLLTGPQNLLWCLLGTLLFWGPGALIGFSVLPKPRRFTGSLVGGITGFVILIHIYPLSALFIKGSEMFVPIIFLGIGLVFFLLKNKIDHNDAASLEAKVQPKIITGFISVLSITFIIMLFSLDNVGKSKPEGNCYYSDDATYYLFNDMAITSELAKNNWPPENPYMAGEVLHYSYLYHTWPAYIYRLGGKAESIQGTMLWCTMWSALMLVGLLYQILLRITRNERITRIFILLFILLDSLNDLNHLLQRTGSAGLQIIGRFIESITGPAGSPPFETLSNFKMLIMTPQLACGLMTILALFWITWQPRPRSISRGRAILATEGILIAGAMAFNPYAALFIIPAYLTWVFWEKARRGYSARFITVRLTSALIPVLIACGIYLGFSIYLPQASLTLQKSLAIWKIIPFLAIGLGFMGIFGIWMFFMGRGRTLTRYGIIWTTAVYSLLIMLIFQNQAFMKINNVSLSLSVVVKMTLLLLTGLLIKKYKDTLLKKQVFRIIIILLAIPFLLSFHQNAKNAISNTAWKSWKSMISQADLKACEWIKKSLAPDAVVQSWPNYNEEAPYSLIATFAERRMAVGDSRHVPLFQIPDNVRIEREFQIPKIYEQDPRPSLITCNHYKIDFIYWGAEEKGRFPGKMEALLAEGEHFKVAYDRDGVTILKVNRDALPGE